MTKNTHGQTFGAWLLSQKGREGLIGQLVDAAKADPKFPRDGDPETVRTHLSPVATAKSAACTEVEACGLGTRRRNNYASKETADMVS